MSVRPEASLPSSDALCGTEGELVSATIAVQPRLLERLLEGLAHVQFPINPQIYHNAVVARIYPDGSREEEPATIVEFPAYAGRLDEVRRLLAQRGFDPASLWAKNMLDEIHTGFYSQPAPAGAPYVRILRYKHAISAC